jgi:hypothetical protein
MRLAITFCNKTEHERRNNEYHNSFFHGCEAKPLYRPIQFGVLHLVVSNVPELSLLRQYASSRRSFRCMEHAADCKIQSLFDTLERA